MSLTYQVTLSRDSIKFLKKQEKAVQIRIAKAIKGLIIQPPMGDIKPLKGRNEQLRFWLVVLGTYSKSIIMKKRCTIDNRGDVYKF